MRSPYRETTREIAEDTRPKHYNRLWFQFVVLLVVLAFGWFLGRSGKEKEIDYIDDNDIVIVDPIDPIDPIDDKKEKIDLKDSYLVRVYETEASETPVWFIELLDADSLWFDFIKANGMRLFTFDPDSDNQAESFVNAAKQKTLTRLS